MKKCRIKKILIAVIVVIALLLIAMLIKGKIETGTIKIGNFQNKKTKIEYTYDELNLTSEEAKTLGYGWNEYDDSVYLHSYNGEYGENVDLKIPKTIEINGVKKTVLGTLNSNSGIFNKTFKTVELPEGMKYIGERAFFDANIKTVKIPSTVESTGRSAFWATIEEVEIFETEENPSKLKNIGDWSFVGDNLKTIKIVRTLNNGTIEQTPDNEITLPEGVESIGEYSFKR